MSIEDQTDWFKVTAYFAGEGTPAERAAFERWRDALPERQRFVKKLKAIWDASNRHPDFNREAAITQVMAQVRETGVIPGVQIQQKAQPAGRSLAWGVLKARPLRRQIDTLSTTSRGTHRGWFKTIAVAASLLVIAGVYLLFQMRQVPGIRTTEMLVYTTGNGQRATIALPDDGTVVLNVASRLEVPLDYMAGHRIVRLYGEGLFTVPHHHGSPFSVVAGTTVTRVLGTTFVVRRYGTDSVTTVAVREGKVSVGERTVSAAQMVTAGRRGVSFVARTNGALFTFASGILTINGVPLRQAIPDLDRWYDADIRFGDPRLGALPLEGEFAAGSLADLSSLLELTYDIRVVREGRVLTLYPRQ